MSVGDGRTAGHDTKIRGTVVSNSLCQRILPELSRCHCWIRVRIV
jgi:hypothetical protein